MYFITRRNSETGIKFSGVEKLIYKAREESKAISKEIGFNKWREGYWLVAGGFSALIFKSTPDNKIFRKVAKDEWMPKLNTKKGIEIQEKLNTVTKVTIDELNQCISFDGAPFKSIGYAFNNTEYFGFIVGDNWDCKIPSDCEEVTYSRYKELFKNSDAE